MSYRIDVSKMDGPVLDENGFLVANAKFTRTGVFPYMKWDGSIAYELRHPDDVFDKDSLESCKSLVVTNDHPPTMVYSENAKDYSVGFTSENIEILENKYIAGKIKVTDQKAINDVLEGGKVQISQGYRCEIITEEGMWDGQKYDYRQKNIRYNHTSLVWEGRAGPEVAIKTDGADKDFAVMKMDSENSSCKRDEVKLQLKSENISKENKMSAKIRIDKMEFEVSESLAPVMQAKLDALETSTKENSSLKDEISKVNGKADALTADLKNREDKIKDLESKLTDDEILKRADSLIKACEFAKEVLGETDKKDSSLEDLKKAVILKKTGIDCDKEKKDAAYINASFETLMNSHEKKDVLKENVEKSVGKDVSLGNRDAKVKAHMDELANRHKKILKS